MSEIDTSTDRFYYALISVTLRRSTRKPGVGTMITEQPMWSGRRITALAGTTLNRAQVMDFMLETLISDANNSPNNVAGIQWTTADVLTINAFTVEPWSLRPAPGPGPRSPDLGLELFLD